MAPGSPKTKLKEVTAVIEMERNGLRDLAEAAVLCTLAGRLGYKTALVIRPYEPESLVDYNTFGRILVHLVDESHDLARAVQPDSLRREYWQHLDRIESNDKLDEHWTILSELNTGGEVDEFERLAPNVAALALQLASDELQVPRAVRRA